jgi:Mannosyltransferase (PIG-V)
MKANPSLIPSGQSWLWLFNAFDSLHFTLIAIHGYSHPEYAYLPGFPILIFLAGQLIGDYWVGAFVVTQVFAMGSIVAFQMVAEQYLPTREALHATLLMSAFPFISVFTTLGYSEPVFLFSTLLAWYFYRKGKIMPASLAAAFAAVTRGYGVLIALPMMVDLVSSKRYNKLVYPLVTPAASLGAWLLFCYFSAGDAFASWSDQKYWVRGGVADGIKIAQSLLHNGLRGLINCCSGVDPTIFWALAIFVILVALTWEVDRLLFIYAAGVSGLLLVVTTYSLSLLRYFPFIFPIWLGLRVKNSLIVAICLGLLMPMTIVVWLYTVAVTFTG